MKMMKTTMIKRNVKNMCATLAVAVCSVLGFSSCEDDDRMGVGDGTGMRVTVDAVTQFSGVDASRAVLDNEIEITNYVLLLYGGTDRTATLKAAHETAKLPADVTLPYPETGKSYLAIMIANTTLASLGNAAAVETATIEDLFSATFDINTTDNNPNDATKFTWSGYRNYASSTRNLTFFLNPNLAKIQVNLTDNSSESDVIYVQVRNVPNKARYAQNALSKAGLFTVDDNIKGDIGYIDYEMESFDLSDKKNTEQTCYWYMPHNEAGTGSRESNPVDAPENATYIEVDGVRGIDFMNTSYKIYPGIDENGVTLYSKLKNFNVKADYQYKITMKIGTDGLTFNTSTHVNNPEVATNPEKVKLPYNSNCYMIHPLGSRTAAGTLYELPINRINEYWGSTYGVNDASMQVGDATEWEAYVIWQDIPERAIYFADKDGNVNNSSTVFSGKGETPIYFKLANQNATSATQTYGNVLIGVRNKSTQTTLWSWHLWITDYNPDAAPSHAVSSSIDTYDEMNKLFCQDIDYTTYPIDLQGIYSYNSTPIANLARANPGTAYSTSTYNATYRDTPAIDGNVQHYYSLYSPYWTGNSKTAWDTGVYAGKWIMDRNLGSQAAGNMHIKDPLVAWGMYYQFGRKDPFSYRDTYDIDGNKRSGNWINNENAYTQGSIAAAIKNPNVFYASGDYSAWVAGNQHPNTNVWYHPKNIAKGGKSVFDPCPPGWCVPDRDAFEFATNSSGRGIPSTSRSLSTQAHALFYIEFDMNGSIKCTNATTNAYTFANTSLRDRYRHMAILNPSNTCGGTNRFMFTVFPMQGYINGEYGTWSGIIEDNVAISLSAGSARGCLWCATPYSTNCGEMIQMNAVEESSSGIAQSSKYSYNGARLTYVYFGAIRASDSYSWKASRGQNVRCIQASGDDPKFYNEAK